LVLGYLVFGKGPCFFDLWHLTWPTKTVATWRGLKAASCSLGTQKKKKGVAFFFAANIQAINDKPSITASLSSMGRLW